MPASVIISLMKDFKIPESKAEEIWDRAKKEYKKSYPDDHKDESTKYKIITTIAQKIAGGKKDKKTEQMTSSAISTELKGVSRSKKFFDVYKKKKKKDEEREKMKECIPAKINGYVINFFYESEPYQIKSKYKIPGNNIAVEVICEKVLGKTDFKVKYNGHLLEIDYVAKRR